MAGGTWTNQKKIRPGAYINFKSKKKEENVLGERGTVTMPLTLPWGPEKQIIEVSVYDDLFDIIGIDINDPSALLIREAFKRAQTLLLYRINEGVKATVTHGTLVVQAKYSGIKGNDIKVVIQSNIDDIAKFDVTTLLGTNEVDKQIAVTNIAGLKSNAFVTFTGTGSLTVTAGVSLITGTDGVVINGDYTNYFAQAELYEWNAMGITTTDTALKGIASNFVKRLRYQEGRKVQVVLEKYPEADFEGVLSIKNGVILGDLTVISSDKAVAFIAGATAGANVNQSNTYTEYDGAIDVDTRYTNKQIENALENGEILFTISNGKVVVEQDINTLKTFTQEKNKDFRKNRMIRALDGINNDVKYLYETRYLGKCDNNADGRNLFKKDIIKLLEINQGIGAVENVIPEDVDILPGADKDAVLARVGVQPVDAMEKLYMEVEVR